MGRARSAAGGGATSIVAGLAVIVACTGGGDAERAAQRERLDALRREKHELERRAEALRREQRERRPVEPVIDAGPWPARSHAL